MAELAAELERVLRLYPPRAVSAPPSGSASATVLSWDDEAGEFQWRYYSAGDYDQNGLVGVSDLTPLGVHFGKSSGGGPFDPSSVESVVDGDSNGLIGISDITPIGQNFGLVCDGYRLYYSNAEADVPGEATQPNGPGAELVADVIFSDATGEAAERKSFSYTSAETPAEGYYWVRPYDDDELGTPSNAWLLGALNQPPIAVLRAAPTSGLVPLAVELVGIFSADLDGAIVKYEWDFDGPIGGEQWLDTGDEGFAEHSYETAGNYLATMRVTDDDGAMDTAAELIRVHDPIPPNAELDYIQENLATPSHVEYDAGGSRDTDGLIVRYEWDFDDDGVFEYDGGAEPTAHFYYWAPGLYQTTVRVTDDDGLSDTDAVTAHVAEHARWHLKTVATAAYLESTEAGERLDFYPPGLLELDGRPALAYVVRTRDTDVPEHSWDGTLRWTLAADSRGQSWSVPIVLDPGSAGVAYVQDSTPYLALVESRPAVIYDWDLRETESSHVTGVNYLRANDALGMDWPAPQAIGEAQHVYSPLLIAAGNPAFVTGGLALYRAADSTGSSWLDPYEIGTPSGSYDTISCEIVEGNPAIAQYYSAGESIIYRRALAADGSAWPAIPTVVADQASGKPTMVIATGHPAVAYYDTQLRRVMYTRALDPLGAAWGSPRAVAAWTRGDLSMTLVDGRPAIRYNDVLTGEETFISANDAEGSSWSFPMAIDPIAAAGDTVGLESIRITSIVGAPAFSYTYAHSVGVQLLTYVRYVSYY